MNYVQKLSLLHPSRSKIVRTKTPVSVRLKKRRDKKEIQGDLFIFWGVEFLVRMCLKELCSILCCAESWSLIFAGLQIQSNLSYRCFLLAERGEAPRRGTRRQTDRPQAFRGVSERRGRFHLSCHVLRSAHTWPRKKLLIQDHYYKVLYRAPLTHLLWGLTFKRSFKSFKCKKKK